MIIQHMFRMTAFVIGIFFLSGCTSASVDAGADKTVQVNNTVHITATAKDTNGATIYFVWKEGSTVVATTASFDYTPTTVGEHTLTVTGTDGQQTTNSDSMIVTVTPAPNELPTADAGSDMSVQVNDTVSISGNGTDPDGSIVSYEWKEGAIVLANSATFSYTAESEGIHTLTLTVTDNSGATASDSMTVTVNTIPNQLPIAVIANIDLNLTRAEFEGIGVQLDATQSTDADGRIIKYAWYVDGWLLSQVSKSKSYGVASRISSSEAEGTEHHLSLKVTDDKGATDTKTVYFTLRKPSAGFLVKPAMAESYGLNSVFIDTNTIPENNVSITVTSSKPNKLNGSTTKSIVFTPQKYTNISLYYSVPENENENYTIHFGVSHSDDINYEGLQLEDIHLTYNPEVLRVNPPKGSKEFISGVKGTLEFIAYIDDMTANILDERNVFYKGPISFLNYELLDAPEGMVFNDDRLTWTPTPAQSNQSYTVAVKVSAGSVEKTVSFDVHVAEDKYLHTEVQGSKVVVVDPNSNLNGLTIEPRDGSDPGLMKIKIAPDSLLPRPLYKENKRIKLTDAFMIENKPKGYVIGVGNLDDFMQQIGASRIALIYYLKHGESNQIGSSRSWEEYLMKNSKTEVFNRDPAIGDADRPYFYFVTGSKFLLSASESNSMKSKGLAFKTMM